MTVSAARLGSSEVCIRLNGESESSATTVASFRKTPNEWTLTLSSGTYEKGGDRRLRLAVKRLCELDAAIGYSVKAGKKVRYSIPRQPTLIDGPHCAAEQILPLLLPRKVEDSLYPYQRSGVAWLLRRNRALLGDDMGLGKTAQALAAVRRLIRWGMIAWALVVVPRTLIANWRAEAKLWAPELTIATALTLGPQREARWSRLVRRAHLLLTSYEQLRNPAEALSRNLPELIIADEAHRLRNLGARSTQGFSSLNVKRFWALTGTPVERDAEDLAVLLSLLDPMRFSADDKSLPTISLRAQVRPYLLRRRKQSVLRELPNTVEINEILELTSKQRVAYNQAILNHAQSSAKGGFLPLFNRLRMLCDVDPSSGSSSKLDRVVELVADIATLGEKAVVFSYVIEPLSWLRRRLSKKLSLIGNELLTGSMSLDERALALKRFRSDPACNLLLASTRVASEGLTLTEANHVIFINRWWNPSSNAQARDRVMRIGQSKKVSVVSFTCRETVEERLDGLLKEKALTFDELIEALSKSTEETEELFRAS